MMAPVWTGLRRRAGIDARLPPKARGTTFVVNVAPRSRRREERLAKGWIENGPNQRAIAPGRQALQTRDVPHLATGLHFALTVEMKMRARIGEDRAPVVDGVAQQIVEAD